MAKTSERTEIERLRQDLAEAHEQQRATRAVLDLVARADSDSRLVFEAVIDNAARLCHADTAAFLNRYGDEYVMEAVGGPAPQFPVGHTIPASALTVVGTAASTLVTVHVEDAAQRPDLPQKGPRTRLAVPVVSDGVLVGIIGVGRMMPQPFTDREIRLVETFAQQAAIAIENTRLFNETKEALERQTAVGEILRVISTSPTDIQPVLDAIATNAARFCAAEDAVVTLIEDGELRILAHAGSIGSPVSVPIERGTVTGRAILERRMVHIPDIAAVEEEYPLAAEIARSFGFRAMLTTPLIRDDKAIGAIGLRRSEPRPFTERQLDLLQTFTDQAVIAIENVRLFNETKEALERQTAISEILNVISNSPTDLRPVLDAIATGARRFCQAEDAAVVLVHSGDQLRAEAHDGPLPGKGADWALDRTSVTGRSIVERRTVHVPDLLAEPDDEYPTGKEQARKYGHRTTLGTPLLREGRALGAILLRRNEVRPFTERQIDLVRTFADQAVIAIENVRLFNETKEALERQTAISEILRVISRTQTDVQPVLDAIAENAVRFCAAEDALIMLPEGDQLRLGTHFGPVSFPEGLTLPIDGRSMNGRAYVERRTIHEPDILAAAEEYPLGAAHARTHEFRTTLVTPLLREGQAIGTLTLRRSIVRPFTEKQIALLQTFADQAVIAIENVRLFNETKEALGQQTAVSEVLGTISRSVFDLDSVLKTVLDRARELCEADHAMVVRSGTQGYVLVAYSGPSEEMREQVATHVAAGDPYRFGPGDEEAIAGRRTVQLSHIDLETFPMGFTKTTGSRSRLVVPLMREEQVLGLLVLVRANPEGFSQRQIALVVTFADQAVIAIENVRLFNETKEALEQQTATADVLEVISTSKFELQPVFDAVVQHAVELCGADNASIVFWSDAGAYRYIANAGNFPDAEAFTASWEGFRVRPGRDTLTGRVLMERRPVQIADIDTDPDYEHAARKAAGTKTHLAVPLLRDGEPIGVIIGRRFTVRPFTEKQIKLLETFAAQAVIAIENVRLFNETNEALEQQTAVAQVLSAISGSAFELRPVLETTIEHATKLCDAQQGFIYRKDGEVYRLAVAYGITPEFQAFTDENPINPMGRGTVTGRVVQDRRTVHVPDVLQDPEYTYREAQRLGNFRAILGVPMIRDDMVIGVMLLWRSEPKPFAEQQIKLVTTFADQAVIAIENARLFGETKEALEQQTVVAEVLKTISRSAFDLQPVLDTVVEHAARLSGADLSWLARLDDEGQVSWMAAKYGDAFVTPEYLEWERQASLAFLPLSKSSSVMGQMLLEERTLHIEDVAADPALVARSAVVRITGSRTVLAVPMMRDGRRIGGFIVSRRTVRPFTRREIELVESFADQGVIAIENVRLFNEIQEKSRQLEVASRHKSEFLANMSHELRTPLNAIIGFTDVMLQEMFGPLNEKQREYLDDVRTSGTHLLMLINDILDLSKIEAGRIELEVSSFSLADILRNAVTLVRERAARHAIAVGLEIPPDVETIEADERKVKQIVVNLMSNAVKFTPDGGRVDVIARRDGEEVEVAVRDNGIGIDPADQERIFEEFQQARRGPERSREGTGLGLTLSKRFVELHGGRIWVESAPGTGSTFTFRLPVRQTAAPGAAR